MVAVSAGIPSGLPGGTHHYQVFGRCFASCAKHGRCPLTMRTCVRMAPPYVELHCHSAFSFLDGTSLPDELAASARELGHEALALTDHNGLYGAMEFAGAAAALGLRAIHGAEVDLDDGRHVV